MDYHILLRHTDGKKIYVDPQEEEGFFLYPGEVRKAGLHDGDVLSRDRFDQIFQEYAVPRARRRALGLLAKKDMTEKELWDKLEKSCNDSRSSAMAVAFVREHGYIDDEAYAKDYFYSHKGKKSFRQIRQNLLNKGIPSDILRKVEQEEGDQAPEDIYPLVVRYARKFPDLDYVSVRKIVAHFARKGYRTDTIMGIIRQIRES